MSKLIYADYNATTQPCQEAVDKVLESFEFWGNPSSIHHQGQHAHKLLENARQAVAKAAGSNPDDIVFTSGGSEANNLALTGSRSCHLDFKLLTSAIEHPSVLDSSEYMKTTGARVRRIPVDRQGNIDLDEFQMLLVDFRPHLVSVMAANNETGVIFPIPEIAALCHKYEILFHTDAVQAFGKLHNSYWSSADFVSISAHKIQGPKGAGALIIRDQKKLVPLLHGGSQEKKRRGGTQNMAGICGFAGACSLLPYENKWKRIEELRDAFEQRLGEELKDVSIQGAASKRLPNTSNIRFHGIRSDLLLSALDMDGICVSAGSACSSGSLAPSHVLLEMGLSQEQANQCLRISWGPNSQTEDFDSVANSVISHVKRIQKRRSGDSPSETLERQ